MSDERGNGQIETVAPSPMLTMWANMLGLGPLVEAATSPLMQQQLKGIMDAILETRARCERIERKLDLVMRAIPTPLPAERPAAGTGGFTPASLAFDGGDTGAQAAGQSAGTDDV